MLLFTQVLFSFVSVKLGYIESGGRSDTLTHTDSMLWPILPAAHGRGSAYIRQAHDESYWGWFGTTPKNQMLGITLCAVLPPSIRLKSRIRVCAETSNKIPSQEMPITDREEPCSLFTMLHFHPLGSYGIQTAIFKLPQRLSTPRDHIRRENWVKKYISYVSL